MSIHSRGSRLNIGFTNIGPIGNQDYNDASTLGKEGPHVKTLDTSR